VFWTKDNKTICYRQDRCLDPPVPSPAITTRVLPMQVQIGDRLTDETGEYEIIGRPYTTQMGKNVHVRVQRVDNTEVTMIRTYAAHERVSVKRVSAEEGKR
jgi:hypothetical protein